ncbi:hypothetical protein Tco_1006295 [Tanacetum coccineum]|uniref:Ribosomal protein L2 n=1 Tax=Tanacetum coccineum TaxID=301880 RepID=A0ABQ5FHK4_9ASTR
MSPEAYNIGDWRKEAIWGILAQVPNKCHLPHNGPGGTQRRAKWGNSQRNGSLCLVRVEPPGHFKKRLSKKNNLKNKNGGNGNAKDGGLAVGNAEKRGNAPGIPL